ncbi:MAG: hypothetical protein RLZ55_373, partial [Actinomycetota bacterium]
MADPGAPTPATAPRVLCWPSPTGTIVASAAWVVAWLPSLLPLGTLLQGVACGLLAAIGYALGATAAATARVLARQPRGPARRWYRYASIAVAATALFAGWPLSGGLRVQAAQLGAPQLAANAAMATVIGLLFAGVLVLVGRLLRSASRRLARPIQRALHRRTTAGTTPPTRGALVLGAVATALSVALVVGLGLWATAKVFDRIDASTADQSPPAAATRSGSTESLIPFDSLGREGRTFVTQGAPASTIRSFAGLNSADSAGQRADLAVRDMLRAGGAQADVWIGITTTGNGQIDPVAAQTAEDATGGRAALVAIQYSTLPSWLSFLVDQNAAREAGVALYDSLAAAREGLPTQNRPKLILYGESLGAYGSPAPFAGLEPAQVASRIDGALWVGPPASTDPITQWTYAGQQPVWQPIVGGGRTARYAASEGATAQPPGDGGWPTPRILVLQNPTDPVVWFTPGLIA